MTYATVREALADLIRLVPDFPAEGVIFEDLTPVLANKDGLRMVIDALATAAERYDADLIGGLDARGFLLGLGIVAIRKKGKLPPPVFTEEYALEYGVAALEIPAEGIPLAGQKVVLIDDVLATGGTLVAARSLLERRGATVVGHAVVLEVAGLGGRDKLGDTPLTVVNADGEEGGNNKGADS